MQKSDSSQLLPSPIPLFSHIFRSELEPLSLESLKDLIKPISNIRKPNATSAIKKPSLLNRLAKHFTTLFADSLEPQSTTLDPIILAELEEPLVKRIIMKYNEGLKNPPMSMLNSSRASMSLTDSSSAKVSQFERRGLGSKKRGGCLCYQMPVLKKNAKKNQGLLICLNQDCTKGFHPSCLNMTAEYSKKETDIFECPYCVLERNDPLLENIKAVLPAMLMNTNIQQRITIDEETFELMNTDSAVGLVIKCIKIEGKSLYDQTWPDSGELFLNNKRVLDFKPLQNNSALKKRKDEKLFTREGLHAGINLIKINLLRPAYHLLSTVRYNENALYMIAVYLVRRLKSDELIKKIREKNVKSPGECKTFMIQSMNNPEEEICMDKVSVNLLDPLDLQTLKTPARSRFCNHLQCFSLENLVTSMEFTVPRRWRCPICKIKAWDLIIDGYQLEILKEIEMKKEKVSEIIFFKNGTYEIMKTITNRLKRPAGSLDFKEEELNGGKIKNEDEQWDDLGLLMNGNIRKKKCLEIINLDEDDSFDRNIFKNTIKIKTKDVVSVRPENTGEEEENIDSNNVIEKTTTQMVKGSSLNSSNLSKCKQKRLIPNFKNTKNSNPLLSTERNLLNESINGKANEGASELNINNNKSDTLQNNTTKSSSFQINNTNSNNDLNKPSPNPSKNSMENQNNTTNSGNQIKVTMKSNDGNKTTPILSKITMENQNITINSGNQNKITMKSFLNAPNNSNPNEKDSQETKSKLNPTNIDTQVLAFEKPLNKNLTILKDAVTIDLTEANQQLIDDIESDFNDLPTNQVIFNNNLNIPINQNTNAQKKPEKNPNGSNNNKPQMKMDNILQKFNKPNVANVFINCGPLYITKNKLSKICPDFNNGHHHIPILEKGIQIKKKASPLFIDLEEEKDSKDQEDEVILEERVQDKGQKIYINLEDDEGEEEEGEIRGNNGQKKDEEGNKVIFLD